MNTRKMTKSICFKYSRYTGRRSYCEKKKDKKLKLEIVDTTPKESVKPKSPKIKQDTMNVDIEKNLADINKKLNSVLTKDDHSFIKSIIKETVLEMKDTILATVIKRIEIVEGSLHEKSIENEELKKEVTNLTETIKEKENEKLKSELKNEIKNEKLRVDKKMNEQEQYSRRNNVRFTQIPGDRRDEQSSETTHKVVDILNETLDLNLTPQAIDIAHRLGPYKYGRNRRVIVKFVHGQITHLVLSRKKLFRGKGLSVFEDLTQLNNEVLGSTRKKLPEEVDQSWSINGTIFIKWKSSGKIEKLEFKKFKYWLDLDWPKKTAEPNEEVTDME